MKRIVLAGINLYSGGTLEIYRKFIEEIHTNGIDREFDVIALVYNKELFEDLVTEITFIEYPNARKTYFTRLYYEYYEFKRWSKNMNIDYWVSMHDITPNVSAKRIYTYFHSSQIFYNMKISQSWIDPICYLKSKFYRYIVNIYANKSEAFIVQACWAKEMITKLINVNTVYVARPQNIRIDNSKLINEKTNDIYTFIYVSFPRCFKNFEVILEACKLIQNESNRFNILLTISGDENRYSKMLYKKYKDLKGVKWIGIQNRSELNVLYRNADVMIFPSKLETWGLPISEWEETGKPMILADLPYAHETSMEYVNKVFFPPDDYFALAKILKQIIIGGIPKYSCDEKMSNSIDANNWKQLLELLFYS